MQRELRTGFPPRTASQGPWRVGGISILGDVSGVSGPQPQLLGVKMGRLSLREKPPGANLEQKLSRSAVLGPGISRGGD